MVLGGHFKNAWLFSPILEKVNCIILLLPLFANITGCTREQIAARFKRRTS